MRIIVPSIWLTTSLTYAAFASTGPLQFITLALLFTGTTCISFFFGASND